MDDDWHKDAACRGMPSELWVFEDKGRPRTWKRVEDESKAKSICNLCPVRIQCEEVGKRDIYELGIWGGLSRTNRQNLRRRETRQVRGKAS